MDKRAVEAAQVEFDRASQSLDDLAASQHFSEVQRQWAAFLVAAGRVYSKLEQGAKASDESKAWMGRKIHERRTDPLLRYLWHARNVDEHAIQAVTEIHAGSTKFVNPTKEEQADFDKKMIEYGRPYAALGMVEVVFPHVKMIDVVDRGKQYTVPQTHLGMVMSPPSPMSMGLLAMAYISKMMGEAKVLGNNAHDGARQGRDVGFDE